MTTDDPFEIAWSPSALHDLARLPEKVATAVVEFVYGALAGNPRRVGHELRFELEGRHSANRGDYRVVYEIDDTERVATILAIDHRSKIYRPR
ncbi:MAG: type II toxin-antitoxin system RelE/ParE family toxin [Acidimicrobiia bacterium]